MKVILVIADRNPLDQPYILNLFSALQEQFEVVAVVPTGFVSRSGVIDRSPLRYTPSKLSATKGRFIGAKLKLDAWRIARLTNLGDVRKLLPCRAIGELASTIRDIACDKIIAVEFAALLACQLAGKKAHFVSLELLHKSLEPLLLREQTVLSCVTQNWLRFLSLFPAGRVPHFLVPNFPQFHNIPLTTNYDPQSCVLAGSAVPGFGLDVIIDFLRVHPHKATLLGWTPAHIREMFLAKGISESEFREIQINSSFQPENDYIQCIAPHGFAFSLYDLRQAHTRFFNDNVGIAPWSVLNYITGFPGKVGMCMNAGVPVITSKYPGTDFVEQHGVGVPVDDFSPDSILDAKHRILKAGVPMRLRCIELAKKFAFSECIKPFVEFVARD